tara:strand:+ start:1843 stop:4836 length:2994 start_codon:yes stop_codon:yes gene_type:complete
MNKKVEVIIGVYPNQISLDLSDNAISIALQYSIDDVRNIDKKNTNYSKTITVPGTKKNNKAFGSLFDVNATFDQFNPNLKIGARIVVDSSPVLEGYLQLTKVKKLNNADLQGNKISYEVVVFDDSIDFMQLIGDKLITDLDFSDKDHVYNKTNIEFAWTSTYDVTPYQYPLLDKLEVDYPYTTKDFKPCFYHKALLLKIAEKAGDKILEDGTVVLGEPYNLEGSFMDTLVNPEYEKEIIGWDGNTPKIPESEAVSREFKAGSTTTQTTLATGVKSGRTQSWSALGLNSPVDYDDTTEVNGFYDNTGNYASPVMIGGATASTYTAPKTGRYTFDISQNFEVGYTASEACTMENTREEPGLTPVVIIRARLKYQDTGAQISGGTSSFNIGEFEDFTSATTKTIGSANKSFVFPNLRVEKNRAIYVEYDLDTERFGWYSVATDLVVPVTVNFKINNTLNGGGLCFWKNTTVLEQNIEDGDDVEVNQYLPSEIKQKDIIADLIKRYNLYIVKHPTKTRTLLLQTRDDYYSSNTAVLDWTQKKDYSSEDDIKFLSDLQNKEVLFTYKKDESSIDAKGDNLGKSYTKSTGDIYGQKKISFENEFVSGIKKIESIFNSPLLVDRGKAVVPTVSNAEGKRNISLLYYGGLLPSQDKDGIVKTVAVKFGDNATENKANYPYAGHYDNPFNPSYDLHFGKVTAEYYNIPVNTVTNNNLFNKHWRNYYNQISTGKLITSKFYLKETDINFIKDNLNARIFVKDSYYNINKIVDYKPLEDGLTKVELLRIEQGAEFTPETTILPTPFLSTYDASYTNTSNSTGPFRSSVSSNVNSRDVMALGVRNYVGSGSSGVIVGDDNTIGGNSTGINVTGNNNTVSSGLENVTIVGDNQTVTESNTSVINGNTLNSTTALANERVYQELEIGSWDWSASFTKSVNHGLSATEWKTIRNLDYTIINDTDDDYQPMARFGYTNLNATSFDFLVGFSGGTDYDDPAVNRGFITFTYLPD